MTPPTTTCSVFGYGRLPANCYGNGRAIFDRGSLQSLPHSPSLANRLCLPTLSGFWKLGGYPRAVYLPGVPLPGVCYGRHDFSGHSKTVADVVSSGLAYYVLGFVGKPSLRQLVGRVVTRREAVSRCKRRVITLCLPAFLCVNFTKFGNTSAV